jgi:hypothetical protein
MKQEFNKRKEERLPLGKSGIIYLKLKYKINLLVWSNKNRWFTCF